MTPTAFWKKGEEFLYFTFFYSALFCIFLVSIWEIGHAWIDIPVTGICHSVTGDYNFFHAMWLSCTGFLSGPEIVKNLLGSVTVVASFAASIFCIRHLLGYNWSQTTRWLAVYWGVAASLCLLFYVGWLFKG